MFPQQFPSIKIIIVNHNGIKDTTECIDSIRNTHYAHCSLIIVDNSDTQEQFNLLKDTYPEINFIRSANQGYAAACNLGVKAAFKDNPDFIMILNNDVVLEKDFFVNIIARSEEKNIGLFTPKILFNNDKSLIWSAGGKISKIKGTACCYHFKESSDRVIQEKFCEFSTGCCMMIRPEVFQKTGLFNEEYFLYFEDTEFSKKVKDAGYKILLLPKSILYHKVSSSVQQGEENISLYYSIRNRLYFVRKNFPALFPIFNIYITLSVLRLKVNLYLQGDHQKIKIIKEAYKDLEKCKFGKRIESI